MRPLIILFLLLFLHRIPCALSINIKKSRSGYEWWNSQLKGRKKKETVASLSGFWIPLNFLPSGSACHNQGQRVPFQFNIITGINKHTISCTTISGLLRTDRQQKENQISCCVGSRVISSRLMFPPSSSFSCTALSSSFGETQEEEMGRAPIHS